MKYLERYVPETKLVEDVLFYGGNMFLCEQKTPEDRLQQAKIAETNGKAEENDKSVEIVKKEKVFLETITLHKIPLGEVMDMQHGPEKRADLPKSTCLFAALETIRLQYVDDEAFSAFQKKYACVMQQECCGSGGRFFEFVTDGRMLFFWKLERNISEEIVNQESGGYSYFRLFKLDLHSKEDEEHVQPEPEEIKERAIKIPDEGDKIALALGFLRNQTQSIYTNKIAVYWPQQQDPFLDDQIVAVKYVYVNEDRNPGRTHHDLQSDTHNPWNM